MNEDQRRELLEGLGLPFDDRPRTYRVTEEEVARLASGQTNTITGTVADHGEHDVLTTTSSSVEDRRASDDLGRQPHDAH